MIEPMNIDGESFDIDVWAGMDTNSEPVQNDQPEVGEPMDIDSEPVLMRPEDNAFSNAKPIDSQNTTAWTPMKTKSGQNTFRKLSKRNKKLKQVKIRRDGINKLPRREPKIQLERSTGLNMKQRGLPHHQKRQPFELSEKDVEKKAKRTLARATSLYHRLIGHEPLDSFAHNCEKTIPDWILLLRKTTLPGSISSSHPGIITAFKGVDTVICGKQGTYLLRRLAYVQLMRLFSSLEAMIKTEREAGRIPRKPGYSNASVALDIYMSAQTSHLHSDNLRRELKERKRTGGSWRDLSEPSPLFTMVYSQASEPIVYEWYPFL